MANRLDLVLLWHMHQPDYRDLADGQRFVLPWTYLHALKDYTDMAAHLERHPGVHAVVNFVPTLTDQIEDYARQFCDSRFRDPMPELLAREDYASLTEAERAFVRKAGFNANPATMIRPFAPYARLQSILRHLASDDGDALAYLSDQWYADVVTWFHLAWIGETERRRPLPAQLLARGARFGADERRDLVALCCDLLSGLLGRYRALAARGQVELSATPFAHPLGPLLFDFECAREAMPGAPLPAAAAYPGGAARFARHVERGITHHAEVFGAPPAGMWPAEGAVSGPVLAELARQGVRWAASSESVLAASLTRHGALPAQRHEWLYRGWSIEGAPGVTMFFRDERLSDLIGFEYSRWHGRDAATHLIGELEAIARAAPAGEAPLVSIILDGENAWEHYPYNGYYFFEELYTRLAAHPVIRTTTYAHWLAQGNTPTQSLRHLSAGSWVHGTLGTWIGDADKNRGWDLLCRAKQIYDEVLASGTLDASARAAAEAQLCVCESSDWFWWLGDYNPPEAVASFERLFRDNLARLYALLGRPAPDELARPLSRGGGDAEGGGTMRRAH